MSATIPATPPRAERQRARPDSRSLDDLERIEPSPARAGELTARREEACPRVAFFSSAV